MTFGSKNKVDLSYRFSYFFSVLIRFTIFFRELFSSSEPEPDEESESELESEEPELESFRFREDFSDDGFFS